MAARSAKRKRPAIEDFIGPDTQVIALHSFRPEMVSGLIERGSYLKLGDQVVRQWPAMFALVIPLGEVFGEIEIER